MSRVLTFSRTFPAYHPKAGEQTFFVEKILNGIAKKDSNGVVDINLLSVEVKSIVSDFFLLCSSDDVKGHTIREGNRWKAGDKFSPRVWSGKPYNSKQIVIAPDIEVKKVWDIKINSADDYCSILINDNYIGREQSLLLAKNDGLEEHDMYMWFNKSMSGQIICWNEQINY